MQDVPVKVALYKDGSLRKATMRLPGRPVPVTVRPTPSVTYICPDTLSEAERWTRSTSQRWRTPSI